MGMGKQEEGKKIRSLEGDKDEFGFQHPGDRLTTLHITMQEIQVEKQINLPQQKGV